MGCYMLFTTKFVRFNPFMVVFATILVLLSFTVSVDATCQPKTGLRGLSNEDKQPTDINTLIDNFLNDNDNSSVDKDESDQKVIEEKIIDNDCNKGDGSIEDDSDILPSKDSIKDNELSSGKTKPNQDAENKNNTDKNKDSNINIDIETDTLFTSPSINNKNNNKNKENSLIHDDSADNINDKNRNETDNGNNNKPANKTDSPPFETRIVGGSVAYDGEFPSFGTSVGDYVCGGTLIHPDIFLTAAHCKGGFRGVQIGGASGEYIPVSKEIPHARFSGTTLLNDIMLVKLSRTATAPVQRLNYNSQVPRVPDPLVVIGVGFTSEGGTLSDELRKVDIKTLEFNQCSDYWRRNGFSLDQNTQLCAGDLNGGKDSCQGDSGGPLYISANNGVQLQVGIVSYGNGCAEQGSPPVYTRVSGYKNFIEETICRESSVPPSSCNSEVNNNNNAAPKQCPCRKGLLDIFCRLQNLC